MKKFNPLTVVKPDPKYYLGVFELFLDYEEEAAQSKKRKLNTSNTIDLIRQYAEHPSCRCYYALDGELVVAMIMASFHDFVFDEPDGSINLHYVKPSHRGSKAGRMVLEALLEELSELPIGDIYAGAESGISGVNNQLYENLLRKYGFQPAGGRTMIKYKG